MAEKVVTSEKASYSPKKMGQLETEMFKAMFEGNSAGAFQARVEMYKEQWRLPEHVAAGAIHFSEAAKTFVNSGNSTMDAAGYLCILSHYQLITRNSGLKFDPNIATQRYIEATVKSSPKNIIPIIEMTKLFGCIYSISSDNETLYDAMELRDSAFIIMQKSGFGSDEDWQRFEGYLTDYYRYLKMAVGS